MAHNQLISPPALRILVEFSVYTCEVNVYSIMFKFIFVRLINSLHSLAVSQFNNDKCTYIETTLVAPFSFSMRSNAVFYTYCMFSLNGRGYIRTKSRQIEYILVCLAQMIGGKRERQTEGEPKKNTTNILR